MGLLRASLLGGLGVLLVLLASTIARGDEPQEPLLRAPGGPYVGAVVDAKTRRPVPDAVVVILWHRPGEKRGWGPVFVDIAETLTDGAGRFVLDVAALERRLAPSVLEPRVVIYKPGYLPYPIMGGDRRGAPARGFKGTGAEVVLTPVSDLEERSEALNEFFYLLKRDGPGVEKPPIAWAIQRSEIQDLIRLIRATPYSSGSGPGREPGRDQPSRPKCDQRTDALWDRYLNGYRGPYRGRVIAAETKAPLQGVVVVAKWEREREYPLKLNVEHYAVRETLTDANGEFLILGDDVECSAPRRTLRPRFEIFLPGYGQPRYQAAAPRRPPWSQFEGPGSTVELPRLKTLEERRDAARKLDPYIFSQRPFEEIPAFMQLLNQEEVAVGFKPYTPRKD